MPNDSKNQEMVFRTLVDVIAASDSGSGVPEWIHILSVGNWDTLNHGKFQLGKEDLQEMVKNFNDGVRKGVPIDAEHDTAGGAYGWPQQLQLREGGTQLWAQIEWNNKGTVALSDKQYRFFSPEFAPRYRDPETKQTFKNVLLGGAITNRPLMKDLRPIMASEEGGEDQTTASILYLSDETMDRKSIMAKAEADRTKEEVKFLSENPEEEETKEEEVKEEEVTKEEEVKEEEKVEANEGSVTITASEKKRYDQALKDLDTLKASEAQAKQELHEKTIAEKVGSWIFSESNTEKGKFAPTSQESLNDFVLSLSEGQLSDFEALVEKMPAAGKLLFNEIGKEGEESKGEEETVKAGETVVKGAAYAELSKKASEYVEKHGGSYGKAYALVSRENPVLASEAREDNKEVLVKSHRGE